MHLNRSSSIITSLYSLFVYCFFSLWGGDINIFLEYKRKFKKYFAFVHIFKLGMQLVAKQNPFPNRVLSVGLISVKHSLAAALKKTTLLWRRRGLNNHIPQSSFFKSTTHFSPIYLYKIFIRSQHIESYIYITGFLFFNLSLQIKASSKRLILHILSRAMHSECSARTLSPDNVSQPNCRKYTGVLILSNTDLARQHKKKLCTYESVVLLESLIMTPICQGIVELVKPK